MYVQLHCMIKKDFSWRGQNIFFPYSVSQRSTRSMSQGTEVTIVTEYILFSMLWDIVRTKAWQKHIVKEWKNTSPDRSCD